MLKVGICDDEPHVRACVKDNLRLLAEQLKISVSIYEYPNGRALLFDLKHDLDMLLIDIEMPGMDGMETARKIREQLPSITIVFVTNFMKYAVDGYRVGAYRYLIKPVSIQQLEQEIGTELARLDKNKGKHLVLKNDSGILIIPHAEIVYFESDRHNLFIHRKKDILNWNRGINTVENDMDNEAFFRCHKSFLINLAEVTELHKSSILMSTGDKLPVSKYRKKETALALTRWLGGLL